MVVSHRWVKYLGMLPLDSSKFSFATILQIKVNFQRQVPWKPSGLQYWQRHSLCRLISLCCHVGANEPNAMQRVSAHPLAIDLLFSATFFFSQDSSQPTRVGALEILLGSSKWLSPRPAASGESIAPMGLPLHVATVEGRLSLTLYNEWVLKPLATDYLL